MKTKTKRSKLDLQLDSIEDRLLEIQTEVADLSEDKKVAEVTRVDLKKAYEAIQKASNALLDVRGDEED